MKDKKAQKEKGIPPLTNLSTRRSKGGRIGMRHAQCIGWDRLASVGVALSLAVGFGWLRLAGPGHCSGTLAELEERLVKALASEAGVDMRPPIPASDELQKMKPLQLSQLCHEPSRQLQEASCN